MTDKSKEIVVTILLDGFRFDWQETQEPLEDRQYNIQNKLFEQWRQNPYKALFGLGFMPASAPASDSLQFLKTISGTFIKFLSRQPDIKFLREKTDAKPEEENQNIISTAPFMNGLKYLDSQWLDNIWDKLLEVFREEMRDYRGSVAQYFASRSPAFHVMGRVFFHLVENKSDGYPFAFMATYSSMVSADGRSKHLPLKNALIEFKDDHKKLLELLSKVSKAAAKSALLRDLQDSGDIFHPIGFTSDEAYTFLKEVPLYEESGILCRIPNWWKNKSNSLRLAVNIGTKPPSFLGFDALLDFDVQFSIGDEKLTAAELKKLLTETEGLIFIKGKWVEINREKLKEALLAYEKAQKVAGRDNLTLLEAIRLQLNPAQMLGLGNDAGAVEVTNGQWLNSVISKLTQPERLEAVTPGDNFNAVLRPYQEKGLAWLHYMKTLGLGACLADDMGLGKTVQVIALLNYIRTRKKEKTLLVIPASLIGNWTDEIKRFAPSLKYYILHPSENGRGSIDEIQPDGKHELFITTYGMVSRYERLKEITWDTVVLDEAQAIKNPGTKQTKAVKRLKAAFKIAMTGTPIENRLSDLWSLFDFLNSGLLGTPKEFTDFARKLKDDRAGYARLRSVVGPFILRRSKTDKSIIPDLPDKIEMKTYSSLTKKQAALYDSLVESIKVRLETAEEGIERKGLILSSIMKFKQICNHPDQYLGQALYSEYESGKYARLRDICETIFEKRERVLVFTQFRELHSR